MRRIREILRLKHESGLSQRAIAQACGVGLGTVSEYLRRAAGAGLGWPLPPELDEAALEARLFVAPASGRERVAPDLVWIHQELKRVGVTLHLLWEEYREVHPDGYGYSQFCELYRRWAGKLKPSMRQQHRAGEKTFIDFSGKRPHLVDRRTGEQIPVELFVAALGASGYTYAEATPTQKLHDWVGAHTRMLEYFGGSSQLWVPDQLKSAITQPCRYEPGVNRSYQELAAHYGAVVVPARPGKAKDKAKVESTVLLAQRWILARLRHRTFFEFAELNAAIMELLEALNGRPLQKLGVSRCELWERLDRPALKPLPSGRYEMAEWKPCRVNIDYHVDVKRHPYSVPYQLVHEKVEVRYTASIVEVYYKGRRVASHARRFDHQPSTLAEHMPSSHRAHTEWTPSRLIHWAEKTGPATGRLVAGILKSRPHPEQGYRACLGLMRLGRRYGQQRLEAASTRAEHLRSYSYRTVKNILTSAQDRLPFDAEPSAATPTPSHANIRGAAYYAAEEENEC
ncbi:MAG: IS21 family transposase [Planctomycetota bacterium]|jgi:transposase